MRAAFVACLPLLALCAQLTSAAPHDHLRKAASVVTTTALVDHAVATANVSLGSGGYHTVSRGDGPKWNLTRDEPTPTPSAESDGDIVDIVGQVPAGSRAGWNDTSSREDKHIPPARQTSGVQRRSCTRRGTGNFNDSDNDSGNGSGSGGGRGGGGEQTRNETAADGLIAMAPSATESTRTTASTWTTTSWTTTASWTMEDLQSTPPANTPGASDGAPSPAINPSPSHSADTTVASLTPDPETDLTSSSTSSSTSPSSSSSSTAASTATAAPAEPTPPTPSASSTGTDVGADKDAQTYLDLHNAFRAEYGAAPVTWNHTMALYAKNAANTCIFEHTHGPYGENIAAGTGGGYNVTSAFISWSNEASLYNWDEPGYQDSYGHFTQIVWKATTQIGCAPQTCADNTIFQNFNQPSLYVVCEYYVAGNVEGDNNQFFIENVGRKT